MKCVILAGGMGTRLSEETSLRPKPMVEIGGKPILWHIMKIYSSYGINEFVICCGYKGYMIKEYFANYFLHTADVTFDLKEKTTEIHDCRTENWKVTLVDTGDDTLTGGRLKRVAKHLTPGEPFCFTYGDGLGNVDISATIAFHKSQKKLATMTVAQPSGRFGATLMEGNLVTSFQEKPESDQSWINGGFFVLEPDAINYIENDSTIWERAPLEKLASEKNLAGYKHHGFWQPMDTLREKHMLESLWNSGEAPWKVWK